MRTATLTPLACLLAAALAGCATFDPPKPWERGNLARPEMQFDFDRLDAKTQQHIYTSKEAATMSQSMSCRCIPGFSCRSRPRHRRQSAHSFRVNDSAG